jgi:DNA-binding IclR family transcriptional regulator
VLNHELTHGLGEQHAQSAIEGRIDLRDWDTSHRIPKLAEGTHSVPAIDKAFMILEMLAVSRTGMTLPEIVKKSGLPKSSVHCILITLQRQKYFYRNENTGRYLFGSRLFSLANRALGGLHLRDVAMPALRALMQTTRLTVHMAILEQHEAVLIAKVDAPGAFRLATWIGKRMEVHCTGLGKALISRLSEEELDRLFKDRGLPRHNENTLASPKRLREDLAKTAKRGYAIDDEEDEIGLRCLGVPVLDCSGAVIAALSLAGGTSQITDENVGPLAAELKRTAEFISRALGEAELKSHLPSV